MRSVARLGRFAAASVMAAAALVVTNAQPALADSFIRVYGNNNVQLGWGEYVSPPWGRYENGNVEVADNHCDGDNGIIAALAKEVTGGVWVNTTIASVRGCNSKNSSPVKPTSQGGPYPGQNLKFSVCKLTPDGVWKDCKTEYF